MSGVRFVLTLLMFISFSAFGDKPSWSYTLEETLKIVNSHFLNRFVVCGHVSAETRKKAALALKAKQIEVCGETQAKNRGDYKNPEEVKRTACEHKVKEEFDFRPYFNGLKGSPEVSFFISTEQNLVGRIASEDVYLRTDSGSSPRAQMTIEQNNHVAISMYMDLPSAFGSDTLVFDPHLAVTNLESFPATHIHVFYPRSPGSSTGIAGQKVGIQNIPVTCKVEPK